MLKKMCKNNKNGTLNSQKTLKAKNVISVPFPINDYLKLNGNFKYLVFSAVEADVLQIKRPICDKYINL